MNTHLILIKLKNTKNNILEINYKSTIKSFNYTSHILYISCKYIINYKNNNNYEKSNYYKFNIKINNGKVIHENNNNYYYLFDIISNNEILNNAQLKLYGYNEKIIYNSKLINPILIINNIYYRDIFYDLDEYLI